MNQERINWKNKTNKHGRPYGTHVKGKHTRGLYKTKHKQEEVLNIGYQVDGKTFRYLQLELQGA